MRTARFVIREGVWGDTAHDITGVEQMYQGTEFVGTKITTRCGASLYWWDAVANTTRDAHILCAECVRARTAESDYLIDVAEAVERHADMLGALTFARMVDALDGAQTDIVARHADSLEVPSLYSDALDMRERARLVLTNEVA